MYVKNNLGAASSNGLSADVPCSQSTSVQAQANDFPVKGLAGPCQKDGKRSHTTFLKFGSRFIFLLQNPPLFCEGFASI